jgi:hypothetical protein
MTVSEQMRKELIDMVREHDYSHQFSDSNSVWEDGMKNENIIKQKIHSLFISHREDMERLLEDCLYERDEQYLNGLTHKTIRNWFTSYVENVNNIFVKPKFEYE